jgi:hypothetical protein
MLPGVKLAVLTPVQMHQCNQAGKKLTWRDGVTAVWILLRERFAPRRTG